MLLYTQSLNAVIGLIRVARSPGNKQAGSAASPSAITKPDRVRCRRGPPVLVRPPSSLTAEPRLVFERLHAGNKPDRKDVNKITANTNAIAMPSTLISWKRYWSCGARALIA